MDFDLFEFDDDDDILSSMLLEPTQHQLQNSQSIYHDIEVIPEFQCGGEDSLSSQFSADGFIKNGFVNYEKYSGAVNQISLTPYDFQYDQLCGRSARNFIFADMCMNIQYVYSSIPSGGSMVNSGTVNGCDGLSYYQRRRQVTQFFHLLLQKPSKQLGAQLTAEVSKLRRLINRITEADCLKQIYFVNSSKGNECNIPAYHLLHGILEWKLLDLCILHKYEISPLGHLIEEHVDTKKNVVHTFLSQLERIFTDLIICSLYLYARKHSTGMLFSSPFPCTCIKEFWLLLQLFLERWSSVPGATTANVFNGTQDKITYWTIFNKVMFKMKSIMDQFSLTALTYAEFANWLLQALARLYGYRSNGHYEGPAYTRSTTTPDDRENYEFCETCLQQFLSTQPNEEQLRAYICLLMSTLLQWWRPKVNVPVLLWEHFHKKLNSSFYIAGSAPSHLAVTCTSGRSYVEKYRLLLRKEQFDVNLSSYTLFTLLLGRSLRRLLDALLQNQAQKLLGRIYTKFSLQKFLALNEMGIHHLLELFLVLALCGEFTDVAPKLRDKLLSIAFNKVTAGKQCAVAKGHVALLILFAEHKEDISDYASKLLQQLAAVRNDLSISKIIADGLLDIFEFSTDLQRGEHLLIDAWLPNFLHSCTPVEQDRTLQALHLIFEKMQQCHEHSIELTSSNCELLMRSLNAHILPFLKQQYTTNFSPWLPQLAADFCIRLHNATNDMQGFQKLFQFFIETQAANRQALPQFLLKLLQSSGIRIEGSTVIQVWLKSLVLLTAVNEEVTHLTKHVVELADFTQMTALAVNDIIIAKEPLCVFIAAIGKNYDATSDFKVRCGIVDRFTNYVRHFEKWLSTDLQQEKSELLFRFYSFIAIVIYNCPHIVYTKSKITCFLHVAMSRFILPTGILIGKQPEGKLAQIIHKVWPVLVQGIGRLNFKTDPYINKTLTDLIQKWTPHFKMVSPNSKVVARPFITCLQQGDHNYDLLLFIFDRLTNMYLSTQRRQADPNACLVITIFQEVIDALTVPTNSTADPRNERRLEIFIKGTSLLMLEHIMMVDDVVPSHLLLLELFKRLIHCPVFQDSSALKELFIEHLRIITKKHLAYYTFFYFDLLTKLTQISHSIVEQIMDFLMAEVRIVEEKRGAGQDNRIRGCLQKLQQQIALAKEKYM